MTSFVSPVLFKRSLIVLHFIAIRDQNSVAKQALAGSEKENA